MPNAIFSLTNIEGGADFARSLQNDFGFELYASGGTHTMLTENGLRVRRVSDYTKFPEILKGRIKTIHPMIHGGIMLQPGNQLDDETAAEHGIIPFELVVVNFYDLEAELKKPNLTLRQFKERIDIGGPGMVRSAVKNAEYSHPVPEPSFYGRVLSDYRSYGRVSSKLVLEMMARSLFLTSKFDLTALSHMSNIEEREMNDIRPKLRVA